MGTMIKTGTDVIAFLKEQHQEVKDAFTRVTTVRGEERARAFSALRRLMAVHETAEEEIVHPAARKALVDGPRIVDARLREEKAAKTALAELEKLDCDSMEFETKLEALQAAVLAHAEAEESEEFARLGEKLDPSRLERMRTAVKFAESVAPTRPHPGVESKVANVLVGPFAAMIDRSRDALSSKR
jgi:hypothetical protein